MKTTFVYFLKDPENPMKGYVGKTDNPKTRLPKHISECRTQNHCRATWINSLTSRGLKPTLEVIDEVPFEHWKQLEVAYIEFFLEHGFELTNGTPGGEDPPSWLGRKHSPKECAAIRARKLGKKLPPEVRAKISVAKAGKPSWGKGKKYTPEHCAAIGAGQLGKLISEATKAKIQAAFINKKTARNTSGFVGVSLGGKGTCKWRARFRSRGNDILVGYFFKIEDAVFARALAMDKHFSL